MNKEILKDFKGFTFLEKIVCVLDLILNPKATNYPIAFYEHFDGADYLPEGHLLTISFIGKKLVYLRWL